MGKRCKYIRKNGQRCNAFAIKGGDYCFTHAPEKEKARGIARVEGGVKRVVLSSSIIRLKRGKIKDVMRFLAKTITDVREGQISPQVANSVFMGCNSLLKCFEIYEIEEKLVKIERQIKVDYEG